MSVKKPTLEQEMARCDSGRGFEDEEDACVIDLTGEDSETEDEEEVEARPGKKARR